MPAKNTKKQPEPDWESVARDYCSCVLTIKEICEKHSKKGSKLNHSRLVYQMQARGYHAKRIEVRRKIKNTPVSQSNSADALISNAADAIQEVSRRHISGLSRTQRIVDVMLSNLEQCIESALTVEKAEDVEMPKFLGERETVADYVRKLGEAQNKAIMLERKCLGLDREIPEDKVLPYEQRLKQLHDLSPALPDSEKVDAIDAEFTEVKH